jgi:hypothetical protein
MSDNKITEASAPQPMAVECDHLWTPDLRGGVVCAKCKAFVEHKIVVPSQPDTGTKDWLDGHPTFRDLIRLNEMASEIPEITFKEALQRLSKGKNDG